MLNNGHSTDIVRLAAPVAHVFVHAA
jgi:hypothetical protein